MPTAWLLGDGGSGGLDLLGRALNESSWHVDAVPPQRVRDWLTGGLAASGPLPNLIVVEAELGAEQGDELVRALRDQPPWRVIPLVVVSRRDDVGRCRHAYQMGASSWVVLPVEPEAARWAADVFARYWARTCLVPNVSALA